MTGAQENVVIGAGDCTVTILPALGGKIGSICVNDQELLQSPLRPLAPRNKTMPFAGSDASGWDECLPSVAECALPTEAGEVHIPDHGDLWRVPWAVLESACDSVTMRATCFSLPLTLTRSIIVLKTPTGWEIQLLYSLTNNGQERVPWAWSAHPLFAVEKGDRLTLPKLIDRMRVECSVGDRFGTGVKAVSWPEAELATGGLKSRGTSATKVDLSRIEGVESGIGDKLFAGPFVKGQDSSCSLERLALGLRITMHFDAIATPYLGLWLCYGGWPETAGTKQMCLAIEPTTAPVDSLAIKGSWSRYLEAGETCSWPLTLKIDRSPQA